MRARRGLRAAASLLAAVVLATLAAGEASAPPSTAGRPVGDGSPAHVLTIHGGSWHRVGPRAVARMAPDAARLSSWGYVAHNIDYRPARRAFADVLAAYDALRARVGSDTPICAYGASAGAHMALMLAVRRPQLACVVSHAAPTDLTSLRPSLRRRARAAFGGALRAWSPARYRLQTPVLLEQAVRDRTVPFSQARRMDAAAVHARVVALDPGPARWVHASVDRRQLARARTAERRFLRRSTARWRAELSRR
jgi:dienelactone hydrolase